MKNTHKRSNPFTRPPVAKFTPEFEGLYVVYVIGPVSGCEDRNEAEFRKAQARLEEAGYHAVIPHDVIEPGTSWLHSVVTSLYVIDSVDGVATLDGVEESFGAAIEATAALKLEKQVMGVEEWLSVEEVTDEA